MKAFIGAVASGKTLSEAESQGAFSLMMSGDATPAQIGGFLMALRMRGETVPEIVGAVKAMRAKMIKVAAPIDAIDVCGTGGDGAGTLNISTPVALICAAAGAPVAKHGNRAASSKSGAADVLMALGVNIDAEPAVAENALRTAGTCFLWAQKHHSAMRHVGPVRAELGTRTIFNVLGPLSNPAGVKRQLIGVYAAQWLAPLAQVLKDLGSTHVWLVHGGDGLDEITTTGPTDIVELLHGKIRSFSITPEEFGLPRAKADALKGGDSSYNAQAIRDLLAGKSGPYRDIVLLNAAAALVVAGKSASIKEGLSLAADAVASGKARDVLARLVQATQSAPTKESAAL